MSNTVTEAMRPETTDRKCDICGAVVAAFPDVMACHCREVGWRVIPQSARPTDEGVERAWRYLIENCPHTIEGYPEVTHREFRAALQAICSTSTERLLKSIRLIREECDRADSYQGAKGLGRNIALICDAALASSTSTPTDVEGLVEALTPSGDTKAAYHGEFHFNLTRVDEAGDEYTERVYVPWDTTKQIMAAILNRAKSSTDTKGDVG